MARYDAHAHQTEAPPVVEAAPVVHASPEADALRDGRPLSINRARAEELELLPGVGPSMAKRIVEAREKSGPFRELSDLARVKGIGKRTRDKLGQFLRFD